MSEEKKVNEIKVPSLDILKRELKREKYKRRFRKRNKK